MKVLVVGCGRLGAELADRLYKRGHEVNIIDIAGKSFDRLPDDFKGRTHEGDVLRRSVLHRAGIENCDVLAAVTNSDSLNLVVGRLAKLAFNVPHVVVRNYDPDYLEISKAMGLTVISSSRWGAKRIEEVICEGDTCSVFSSEDGQVKIYEISLPETFSGKTVIELTQKDEVSLAAISRDGKSMIPAADMKLVSGDLLYVSATRSGFEKLNARLSSAAEEV
jgi:trk system potassium uptake protein TrkA